MCEPNIIIGPQKNRVPTIDIWNQVMGHFFFDSTIGMTLGTKLNAYII